MLVHSIWVPQHGRQGPSGHPLPGPSPAALPGSLSHGHHASPLGDGPFRDGSKDNTTRDERVSPRPFSKGAVTPVRVPAVRGTSPMANCCNCRLGHDTIEHSLHSQAAHPGDRAGGDNYNGNRRHVRKHFTGSEHTWLGPVNGAGDCPAKVVRHQETGPIPSKPKPWL